MQRYQNIMGTLSNWIFLLLVIALPYPDTITRPLWVAWLVSYLLEGRLFRNPHLKKESIRSLIPVGGLCFLIAWESLSSLWAGDTAETWLLVGRHINFLAVFLIAIFGTNNQLSTRTILRTFIITSVASVGVYLMLHYWVMNPRIAMWKGWHEQEFLIDWLKMQDLTFHIKHRLQYGTLLTLAIVGIILSWKTTCREQGTWQGSVLSSVAVLILAAGIYWSGSRESILNLVICFSVWAIWKTPGKKKIITALALIIMIVGGTILTFRFYPRFAELTPKEIFSYHPELEEPASEPRIAIWDAAISHPTDYMLYGVGAGNCTHYMVKQYEQRGWVRYVERQFSPHNQYLSILIDLGLVAAIPFLLLWILTPWCYTGKARQAAIFIIIVIMMNMTTDLMIGTIDGILATCVALLFLTRLQQEEQQKLNE